MASSPMLIGAAIPLTELIICTLYLLPRLSAHVKPTARIALPIFKPLFWFLQELAHTLRSSGEGPWNELVGAGERSPGRVSGNGRAGAVHKTSGASGFAKGRLSKPNKPRKQRRKGKKEDDEKKKPPDQNTNPEADLSSSPFACPFYLYDRHGWHHCLHYTLTRIVDVRQHLLRAHLLPPQCPTCGQEFEDDSAESDSAEDRCNAHIQLQGCQPLPFLAPRRHGVTGDQLEAIRRIALRRTGRRGPDSPTAKWYEIWDIIFPGSPHPPSPYITERPDIQRIMDMTHSVFSGELWRNLILPIRGGSPSLPNMSRNTVAAIAERLIDNFRWMNQNPEQPIRGAPVDAVAGNPIHSRADDSLQQRQAWEPLRGPSQPTQATGDPLLSGHTMIAAAADGAWMTQPAYGHPSFDGPMQYDPTPQVNQALPPFYPNQDLFTDAQESIFSFEEVDPPIPSRPRSGTPSQYFINDYEPNTSGVWDPPGADAGDTAGGT